MFIFFAKQFQTIADVATDKMFTQIPSPFAGKVHKVFHKEEDTCLVRYQSIIQCTLQVSICSKTIIVNNTIRSVSYFLRLSQKMEQLLPVVMQIAVLQLVKPKENRRNQVLLMKPRRNHNQQEYLHRKIFPTTNMCQLLLP